MPAERRVQALDSLVSSALAHGLPTDRGVRPQVHVEVDLAALAGDPLAPPAEIHGAGPIGPGLLAQLMCDATVHTVTTHGHSDGPTPQTTVLDVGRSRRLATPRQRVAVLHRQGGRCATPGCGATHLEVHHVQWWDRDAGPTDLANLIGLCSRCHAHVHLDRLHIAADGHGGWTISRPGPLPLIDHQRRQRHAVRRRLRALRRAVRHAASDEPQVAAMSPLPRRDPRPADVRRTTIGPPRRQARRRPAAPLRT